MTIGLKPFIQMVSLTPILNRELQYPVISGTVVSLLKKPTNLLKIAKQKVLKENDIFIF